MGDFSPVAFSLDPLLVRGDLHSEEGDDRDEDDDPEDDEEHEVLGDLDGIWHGLLDPSRDLLSLSPDVDSLLFLPLSSSLASAGSLESCPQSLMRISFSGLDLESTS